jgi:hypothetical protein
LSRNFWAPENDHFHIYSLWIQQQPFIIMMVIFLLWKPLCYCLKLWIVNRTLLRLFASHHEPYDFHFPILTFPRSKDSIDESKFCAESRQRAAPAAVHSFRAYLYYCCLSYFRMRRRSSAAVNLTRGESDQNRMIRKLISSPPAVTYPRFALTRTGILAPLWI